MRERSLLRFAWLAVVQLTGDACFALSGLRGRTTFMREIFRSRCIGLATAMVAALVLVAGAALTPQAARAAAEKYSVTDLGTLGGASAAFGINNRAEVVGCSALSGFSCGHAFFFDGGAMLDLGTLPGGTDSVAYAINNRGQVVGTSALAGFNFGLPFGHAFLFSDGQMSDLGTLGGSWSEAFAINASGDVAGGAYIAGDTTEHAFVYDKGTMSDISPPGSTISVAFGINASDEVAGLAYAPGPRAFLFRHGQATLLGTLGGSDSEAKAINASGEVVGGANLPGDTTTHAFLYRHGQMIDLGSLGGSVGLSEALAINDAGLIVGISTTAPGLAPIHAFLSYGPTMVNLNDLIPAGSGWDLEWATGINNRGQIVGFGIHGGEQRAYLLTPMHN
jgi:probable HAF family extracellular repeat protein